MKIRISNDRDIRIQGRSCPAGSVQDFPDDIAQWAVNHKFAVKYEGQSEADGQNEGRGTKDAKDPAPAAPKRGEKHAV